MKKIIFIFAVVLMLVFSCVPAFAESQVIDGYAVTDVPYNEAFEGVLTASDSGSQLYSSSENMTYNTPSVLSAPVSSSDPLYYFKSIMNIYWTPSWLGSNWPSISSPTDSNGYSGLTITWNNNTGTQTFGTKNTAAANIFEKLQGGRRYRISFSVQFTRSSGSFDFFLASYDDFEKPLITLFKVPQTINLLNNSRSVSIDFTMPEGTVRLVPVVKGTLYQSGNSAYDGNSITFYIRDITIIDITTEDLDNSIDKGVQKIENAGSDEPPLDTDISAFQSAIDTMNGWLDQLDEFANSIDSAGQTVSAYISKGTELFNGFMGIAPASVIALVAFGVVFLVIRKIVGR